MAESKQAATDGGPVDEGTAYEPPSISWIEPYEPVGFGVSCAKQEGNPGCFPGPILT